MNQHPLTIFLQSNYTQKIIKKTTREEYNRYLDYEIDSMARDALATARTLPDEYLANWLDKEKGLTPIIKKLPYERFVWETYKIDDLVMTLWVSDGN